MGKGKSIMLQKGQMNLSRQHFLKKLVGEVIWQNTGDQRRTIIRPNILSRH